MTNPTRTLLLAATIGVALTGCNLTPPQSPPVTETVILTPSPTGTGSTSARATGSPSSSASFSGMPSPSISTYTPSATESGSGSPTSTATGSAVEDTETTGPTGGPDSSATPSPADVARLSPEQEAAITSELEKINSAFTGERAVDRAVNVCEDLLENEKSRAEIVERTKQRFTSDTNPVTTETAEQIVKAVESSDFCVRGG